MTLVWPVSDRTTVDLQFLRGGAGQGVHFYPTTHKKEPIGAAMRP